MLVTVASINDHPGKWYRRSVQGTGRRPEGLVAGAQHESSAMTAVPAYQDAFDFIYGLEQMSDIDAIMDAMERVLARYGFTALLLTGVPGEQFEQAALATRWPAEYLALYIRNGYVRSDPIARRCRRSPNPFEWTGAYYYRDPDPRTAEVMRRAAEFGMERGFVVPIHKPDGFAGCVSM